MAVVRKRRLRLAEPWKIAIKTGIPKGLNPFGRGLGAEPPISFKSNAKIGKSAPA